jgi:tetratricopeptide (TPR) repeat protein
MAIECPKCQHENSDDSLYCGKCTTPLRSPEDIGVTKTLETPAQGLTSGSTFAGRYQIIEELGKGGMGAVYKALDTQINEEVAIKLIRPEIASDEKTLERFSNELKLARKISHKNVCRMFHLEREGKMPYISMEYLEGEDLKDLIRKKEKLTQEEAIGVATQVCEGLAEAHRLGVVHRDLKPQNIMMDKEGNAKIMDFGIARSVEAPGVTATGVIIGTPDYISPEQAEGQEADHRSDIYSLGVILYEMVTGRVPFKGDTAFSVALKHKTQLPQDPRRLNPEVSESFSRLILICMEKDRERRYQNAEALLADLQNIEDGLPLGTKIRPRRATFTQTLIRKKLLIPALVVALSVVAVAIWQLLPQKEALMAPKIENSMAIISFENRTGDNKYDHLQKVIPDLLITNLENTGYFYVATWERLRDLLKQMGQGGVEFIDSDTGFELCRREGIEVLVIGSLNKAGDMFATDVKVLDAETKKLVKSASSKGIGEQSILETQIDELSREISQGMGVSLQKVEAAQLNISEVTTTSIEAYKYFIKGSEDFGKYYEDEARQSFEKAVILDPEFAMAYLGLARSTSGEARNEAYEKAKTYSQKTTEKERLYIEAFYAGAIERDYEKRFSIFKEIASKYPKEKNAHYYVGLSYQQKSNFDKALEEYNKVLELDPSSGSALNQLATAYMSIRNYEKAIEYYKKYISVHPGDANPLDSLAGAYYYLGRIEEAEAKYKEALEVKPNWINSYTAISYINALKENYSEAMVWADQCIDKASAASVGYLLKGFYYFWLGRIDQSLKEIRTALLLADSASNKAIAGLMEGFVFYEKGEHELARESLKNWCNYLRENMSTTRSKLEENAWLGRYDLEEGRIDSAKARLAEMKSLLPLLHDSEWFSKYHYKELHDSLYAEILLAEGSLEEAAAIGKELAKKPFATMVYDFASSNLYISKDVLARIYLQKGELDKAITEYERLMIFDPESKDRLLIHPKYHYRLAVLYEEKGKKRKAIEHYEKFLNLWKNADPGIAEVEDTRKRLVGLK